MDEPVYVVFNPHSGKGRGAQFVAPVLQALAAAKRLEHGLTAGAGRRGAPRRGGDPPRLPPHRGGGRRRHLEQRRQRHPAHGGPGAAWASSPAAPAATWPRPSASPRATSRPAAASSSTGATRTIDVGRIEDKHFLNIAGFGYDVAVLEDSWNVGYLEGERPLPLLRPAAAGLVPGLLARGRGGRPPAREARPADAHRRERPDLRRRLPGGAARRRRGREARGGGLRQHGLRRPGERPRAAPPRHAPEAPARDARSRPRGSSTASRRRPPTRRTASGTRPARRRSSSRRCRRPCACWSPAR